jgi:hypothetical protein
MQTRQCPRRLTGPLTHQRSSTATCSTGNCTWPLYPTLGVCHDCEDVSHLLEYFCKNHTSLDIAAIPRGALDPCGFRVNNTFVVGLDGDLGFRQATSLSTVFVDTFNASLTFLEYYNIQQLHPTYCRFLHRLHPWGPTCCVEKRDTRVS